MLNSHVSTHPRLLLGTLLALGVGLLVAVYPAFAQESDADRAPTGLTAQIVDGGIALSWTAPAEDADSVDGYEILRRQPGVDAVGSFHSIVADTESADTSYTDTTTEAGNSYTYRVKALRGEAKSGQSNYVRVDLPAAPPSSTPTPTSEPTPTPEATTIALTGFTLVNAADQTVLATLADGDSLELDNPDTGSLGIRAEIDSSAGVESVQLELSGQQTRTQTENLEPYSLYGDDGSNLNGGTLPAGSYTLSAKAYSQDGLQGDELDTLEISFTVAAAAAAESDQPDSAGEVENWLGTMTVASTDDGPGYSYFFSQGSLTPNSFSSGEETITVYAVILSGGTLSLSLSSAPGAAFEFQAGDESLASSDATMQAAAGVQLYEWNASSLSWAVDDSVSLSLVFSSGEEAAEEETGEDARVPTGLSGESLAAGILLTWQAPASDAETVTSYTLERTYELAPGLTATVLLETGGAQTSYLDTSAAAADAGTVYTYRVRAERGDTAGDWSTTSSVEIPEQETAEATPGEGEVLWSAVLTVARSQFFSAFGYTGLTGAITSTEMTWDGHFPALEIYNLSTSSYSGLSLMGTAGSPEKNQLSAGAADGTEVYDYILRLDDDERDFADAGATVYEPSSENSNKGHVVFKWSNDRPEWSVDDSVAVSLRKQYPLESLTVSNVHSTLAVVTAAFSRPAAAHTLYLRLQPVGGDAWIQSIEVEAGATSVDVNLGGLDASTVYQLDASPDADFPEAHTAPAVTFTTPAQPPELRYDYSHNLSTYTVDGVAQPVLWDAQLTVDTTGSYGSDHESARPTIAKATGPPSYHLGSGYSKIFWQNDSDWKASKFAYDGDGSYIGPATWVYNTSTRGALDHTSLTHESVEHDVLQLVHYRGQLRFMINAGKEMRQDIPLSPFGICNGGCETPFDWMLVVEDGDGNSREFRRDDSSMSKQRLNLWRRYPGGTPEPTLVGLPFADYNIHTWDADGFDWGHGDSINAKLVKLPTNRVESISVVEAGPNSLTVEVTYTAPEDYIEEWSGTMTVASNSDGHGYSQLGTGLGSLTPNSFSRDRSTISVQTVLLSGGTLSLSLSPNIDAGFRFRIGTEYFESTAATYRSTGGGNLYQWSGTSLSWAVNDSVSLGLLVLGSNGNNTVHLSLRELVVYSTSESGGPNDPAGPLWQSAITRTVPQGSSAETFRYTFSGLREGVLHQIRASFNSYINPTVSEFAREYVTVLTPCEPGGTWCHAPLWVQDQFGGAPVN